MAGGQGSGLRLATWNIASNKDFAAVAAKIAGLGIDICALQEVSLDPADLPVLCDPAGAALGDYVFHFSPALGPEGLGGGRAEHYGLAILARRPFRRVLAFQIGPERPGRAGQAEFEPRILQVAMPDIGTPLIVANTHLAATADLSPSASRRAQAVRIARILRPLAAAAPVLLCGDFNAGPASGDLAELRTVLPHVHAGSQPTYLGEPEHATIDFVWSSAPRHIDIATVPPDGLSDHALVVADL